MTLRPEAKVGLTVFVAILAMIAIYWFLGFTIVGSRTYRIYGIFDDARKLDKGADVRMAGVRIGQVAQIRLTSANRVHIEMAISQGERVPDDSVARITTGGLIGDNYMEIIPGSSSEAMEPGQRIDTAELVSYDQLLEQTENLMSQLQVAVANLNTVLGDRELLAEVKGGIKSLNTAAHNAAQLTGSANAILQNANPRINRMLANLDLTAARAAALTGDLQNAVNQEARPGIRSVLSEAHLAAANLNETLRQAQQLIGSFGGTSANLDRTLTNAGNVLEQSGELIENLTEASIQVRSFATDAGMQESLRQTIRNTAEATEQAKELLSGLNQRFGTGRVGGATREQRTQIPEYGAGVRAMYDFGDDSVRVDANYTLAGRDGGFYRFGLFDIGEGTRVNAQIGKMLDSRSAFRYGLHASRVGVGYDRQLGQRLRLSANLFRPDDPQLEVYGIYDISPPWGIYGGFDDLFDSDERDVLLGVQYRR